MVKANILIVDDNVANLDTLAAILAQPDYEITRARSGDEALRLLLKGDFALAVLDVRMPCMDGFECAKLIRSNKRYADLPIIFLTGVATDMEFIFQGYSAGGVDYLIKPFEPAVVRAKVAVLVELYLGRQRLKRQIADLEAQAAALRRQIGERPEAGPPARLLSSAELQSRPTTRLPH